MYLSQKHILITGGAGFIGSNLAEYLSHNNDIIVVDDLSLGSEENLKGLNVGFIKASILEDIYIDDVDVIFHLAAIPGVQDSINRPIKTAEINITGTVKMLELARKMDVESFVFASSCAVYGDPKYMPVSEKTPVDPLSPYATQKLASEHLVRNYSELYGIKGVSARFFNVYGPRQDTSSEYSAVIPKFISLCLDGKAPVIFGTGEQTRDFVYVKDLVRGLELMAAIDHGENVINLGSGIEISINQLAGTIADVTGCGIQPEHAPGRKGEVERSMADISLARRTLGWEPKHSFEEGIHETIASLQHKHI